MTNSWRFLALIVLLGGTCSLPNPEDNAPNAAAPEANAAGNGASQSQSPANSLKTAENAAASSLGQNQPGAQSPNAAVSGSASGNLENNPSNNQGLRAISNSSDAKEDQNEISDEGWEFENTTIVDTRRILYGSKVLKGARPYMVYLQLTKESAKAHKYRGWLCGGVIVERYYVLTSAACVEDADRFYIVSGTTKYVEADDYKSNECVCKHRRRVVWKCIPKNYKFDFQDSIKWSSNDIAIVKVDRAFKLGVCEKGCEFPADMICYNNISRDLEKAGTKGYIAGWGSVGGFREGVYRKQMSIGNINSKCLQEAKVCIMDKESCAKKWAQKFRNIIAQYMICTKDVMKKLSEICDKRYANCTDIPIKRSHDDEVEIEDDDGSTPTSVDLGRHLRDPDDYTARRQSMQGGFCENDHGGPLIVKYQGKERVVGVISACKIDPKTHSCHGPFLYTSVFTNRQFLSCAIYKDVTNDCRRVFRTGITHEEVTVDWAGELDDRDDEFKERAEDDPAPPSENPLKLDGGVSVADAAPSAAPAEGQAAENSNSPAAPEATTANEANQDGENKKKSKRHKKHKKPAQEGSPANANAGEASYESSKDENVNDPAPKQ